MEFSCETCEYKTRFKHNLTRHLLIIHKKKSETSYVKCREKDCSESFRTVSSLRNHLKVDHNIEIIMEELSFDSIEGFENWKALEEETKKVHFVLHSGKVQKFRTECSYYYCNRTGIFNSRASQPPKKKPKHEGTCKLNSHCTAGLTVTITSKPLKVNVLYYKTHYNHNPEEEPEPTIVLSYKKCVSCKKVISKSAIGETIIPSEKCASCNKVLSKSKQDGVKTLSNKPMSKKTASPKTVPTKTVPKTLPTIHVSSQAILSKKFASPQTGLSTKSAQTSKYVISIPTKSALPITVATKLPQTVGLCTKTVLPQTTPTKSVLSQTLATKSVLPQPASTKSVLPAVKVVKKSLSPKTMKKNVPLRSMSTKRLLSRKTIKQKTVRTYAAKANEVEKQQILQDVVQIAFSN